MSHDPIYIKCTEQANLQIQKVDQQLPEAGGGIKWETQAVAAKECRASLWGDENVLELDSGDGYTTL